MVEQSWWNSGTVMVGQWNSKVVKCAGTVEQCAGTVEQSWWNSVVEKSNSHGGTVCGGTVEQSWWNSVVEQ